MKTKRVLLLHGKPVRIEGVGLAHSPLLKDIFDSEDSFMCFTTAKALLTSSANAIRDIVRDIKCREDYGELTDMEFDHLSKFDLIWGSPQFRSSFGAGLTLFFNDRIVPYPDYSCYVLTSDDKTITGTISKDNFASVCEELSGLLNPHQESAEDLKFASEAARKLWEKHNQFEEKSVDENAKDYSFDNIISKLSCGTTGYTLLNIYELSVYQLLDQFDAYTQNRVSGIGERAYSHWGGDDFDAMSWFHNKS